MTAKCPALWSVSIPILPYFVRAEEKVLAVLSATLLNSHFSFFMPHLMQVSKHILYYYNDGQ